MTDRPTLTVLAGTNGAGKSSLAGAVLEARAAAFFNPDREAQSLRRHQPELSATEANAIAWSIGRDRLTAALRQRQSFNFETTLGGNTIRRLLQQAHGAGLRLRIWYCGLDSVERHLQRVRARVGRGGHDIPEAKIRERFDASRENLCRLMPSIDELLLFDNSIEADPYQQQAPAPRRLLHLRDGVLLSLDPVMPEWAKPIAAAVLSAVRPAGPRS